MGKHKVDEVNGLAPYRHENHRRPVTRRDFLAQGMIGGVGMAFGPSLLGFFGNSEAGAAMAAECGVTAPAAGPGMIPIICVDLAGGANIAGSNVSVGKQGGVMDFLDDAGYLKLGLNAGNTPKVTGQTNAEMGLTFAANSAMLQGILQESTAATRANVDGCVICTRSNDDTQNNPHNPVYGIARAGAKGQLVALVGTRTSVAGGNSIAPASQVDATLAPTKVATVADTRGLVDTGKLGTLLGGSGAVRVMQAIEQLSAAKGTKLPESTIVKDILECAYAGTTKQAQDFGNPDVLNPSLDPNILSIFTAAELGNADILKTACIMKLVLGGFAGAGTIQLGGYDYHTGNRTAGEAKDILAGRVIGGILEYARLVNKPVMVYVFSDGAVSSNGNADANAGGKPVWTSDNGTCAASFFLVFNPAGRPQLANNTGVTPRQLGYYRATGSIETAATPFSNNVTQLAEAVILNYLALNNQIGKFSQILPTQGLGAASTWDNYIMFNPIV
jgi:hypothetical protein